MGGVPPIWVTLEHHGAWSKPRLAECRRLRFPSIVFPDRRRALGLAAAGPVAQVVRAHP